MKKILILTSILLAIAVPVYACIIGVWYAGECISDSPSEMALPMEVYDSGTTTVDGYGFTTTGSPVISNPSNTLNQRNCGTKTLKFTDLDDGDFIYYQFSSATAYLTGYVKLTGLSDTAPDNTDRAYILTLSQATSGAVPFSLKLINNSGTYELRGYYYDGSAKDTTGYTITEGATAYFEVYYDNSANLCYIGIGSSPSNLNDLLGTKASPQAITTTYNPDYLLLGIITSTGINNGYLDVEFDSLSIDNSDYKKVEYK